MKKSAIGKAVGMAVLLGGAAFAADQLVPTKILLVKSPPAESTKRKIKFKAKEKASAATVAGDPTVGGATLHVVLTPGGDECFSMPASGWRPIGDIGFKYRDAKLANGAVKVAQIKKTPSGVFRIKAILKGDGSQSIDVVPGGPTATYATNFTLGGGDSYCAGTGTGTPKPNDDKTFKVVNDTPPASCAASACAPVPSTSTVTTTTSSTTTTATTPGSCGDGVCFFLFGEYCDNCPVDCGPCGTCVIDGMCDRAAGESCIECSADCGACSCGPDGSCDTAAGENCATCGSDCNPCFACGDGFCAGGETCGSCPSDCCP